MSLNQSLKDIGLNDKEVKVYVTLLKSGRLRPSALSKLTGINRATIYHTAKDLVNRGLIAEDLGGATIYLTALPPENLKQIIERQDMLRRSLKRAGWAGAGYGIWELLHKLSKNDV